MSPFDQDERRQTQVSAPDSGVLRRHIWGYAVCLCPIKRTPGLNELSTHIKLPSVS